MRVLQLYIFLVKPSYIVDTIHNDRNCLELYDYIFLRAFEITDCQSMTTGIKNMEKSGNNTYTVRRTSYGQQYNSILGFVHIVE